MALIISNPVKEDRSGIFSIDQKFFEKEPNLIMRIMGRCIIVEATGHFLYNSIEYHAYSPDFEKNSSGRSTNYYNIEIKEDNEGKKEFKFVKQENGSYAKILSLRTITY